MNAITKYALLLMLALSVQGCSAVKYTYDDKLYDSAKALSVQTLYHTEILAGVTKNSSYVGDKALVFFPDSSVIITNGIKASPRVRGQMKEEFSGYLATMLEKEYLVVADAVKKDEFFDSTAVSRDLAEIPSEKPDYVVTLETTGVGLWQWYVYRADNPGNKIPVSMDASKKGAGKINSFNAS
ncbi:MAG: hypothetical protein LBU76_09625 [Azoarcus sp.]|jgi:hypothetical protein|nr:hypothetical protein [Azoarcus sp.]